MVWMAEVLCRAKRVPSLEEDLRSPLFLLLLLFSPSLVQWEVATNYHPLAICPILKQK
jgi:hypothetical protein